MKTAKKLYVKWISAETECIKNFMQIQLFQFQLARRLWYSGNLLLPISTGRTIMVFGKTQRLIISDKLYAILLLQKRPPVLSVCKIAFNSLWFTVYSLVYDLQSVDVNHFLAKFYLIHCGFASKTKTIPNPPNFRHCGCS